MRNSHIQQKRVGKFQKGLESMRNTIAVLSFF